MARPHDPAPRLSMAAESRPRICQKHSNLNCFVPSGFSVYGGSHCLFVSRVPDFPTEGASELGLTGALMRERAREGNCRGAALGAVPALVTGAGGGSGAAISTLPAAASDAGARSG